MLSLFSGCTEEGLCKTPERGSPEEGWSWESEGKGKSGASSWGPESWEHNIIRLD